MVRPLPPLTNILETFYYNLDMIIATGPRQITPKSPGTQGAGAGRKKRTVIV